MTCDQRKDLILLLAADAIDDDAERDELRAHIASGCPACAASLAEAQATVAHLPLTLASEEPPESARDRLMQRVLSNSEESSSGARQIGMIVSSIAAGIAIALAIWFWSSSNSYRKQLAEAERANTMLRARNVQLVSLAGLAPQPDAWGRVIWDRDHDQWRVTVFGLKSLPPDKVYQLWFLTPKGEALPAPTFKVGEDGNATLAVNIPKEIGPVDGAGITIENVGGAKVPTQPIQLAGKAQ